MPAAAPKRPKSASAPSAPSAPKKPTSKSKTGNSACSQAASNWQLAIRGKAPIEPDTYKTLAKCRGMLRTSKAADGRAAAGYNLSDQGAAAIKGRLQSRFDRDLVSDKSRAAKVKELLAGRKEKQAAAVAKPDAAATETGSKRLEKLQESLSKKETNLDRRFDNHFSDVRGANGQPLNDKRNGASTVARWDRQSDGIRSEKAGIEKTKKAIQREQDLISNVASTEVHPALKTAMDNGEITQWRKYPNRFFVPGVDKGRIVFDEKNGTIGVAYLSDVSKEHYPKFRDAVNKITREMKAAKQAAPVAAKPAAAAAPAPALPPRTLDTMSEAVALSSPNGRMSKRSREAANQRLGVALFGPNGMPAPQVKQPSEVVRLRREAGVLRDLASRGMKPRAYAKEAKRLEEEAMKLESVNPAPAAAAIPRVPKTEEQRMIQLERVFGKASSRAQMSFSSGDTGRNATAKSREKYRVVSGREEALKTEMKKTLDRRIELRQSTPAFSLRGGPQFGSNSRTDQGVLFSTPTALDKQVQSEQAARGKALAGQTSMFDRPAPAPAKFSRNGELAPGRGTSERSDLASNKRLYRKAMQSVKVTPDSFGTGAIVPFQKTESAPAKKKGRNTDQQITKASIRPNSSKESDFLKPVAEQRPGMASTRETITKVKAKERTRAENQSGVQTLKTGQLTADPDQFQYKMNTAGPVGVTNQFKETKVWNKELAGVIQVWKSPSNSKTFVVNGHHRYELAQRLGVSKLNVQYIQAQSPAEARMKGALTNIAEGRGTSVDAAKFFRDQPNVKDWSSELKSKGINLSERTASEGLALKDVHPKIWRDVVNEMTPLSRAVSIGKSGLQQEDQFNLYNRSTAGNWTSGKTSEFATELKNSARTKVKSGGLFGDDEEVSVFEHRAALSDRLKGRLSSDKNLFSKVARGRNASRIESVGANRIDKESSASRATEADNALMTFDRERKYSGRVNNELNNFGKRVAGGEKVDKVYNEFEKRMTQTLRLINQGKFERRAARLKAVTR